MLHQVVEFSVKRRVTIFMISAAVIAFGMVALSRLSINLLPALSYPSLTVQTEFENAAPAEIEQLISRPVEEVVGVLKGLKQIHSISRAGVSEVILEFSWDANMTELAMDIREKLDRLELPREAEKPIVLRYDPSFDPIIKISLSGDFSLSKLRFLGDREVKEALERIEGVASAKVQGGEEEEIHININQGKLAALGISTQQLSQLVASSNINRPGGSLKNQQTQLLVRTLNEYDDLQEMRDLRVTPVNKSSLRLGDVAEVSWASKDKEEIARFNGQEGVLISIYKEADANTVEVANNVRKNLEQINRKLPKGSQLVFQFDQSRFIQQSIDEVKSALIVGGLLAICILYLFLRDFKLTSIIATAIPLSVIATFIFMYRSDISLNIMSLGGLTLGVGMLVDSAIVVLESIHRQREKGMNMIESAVAGTSEVGGAVAASVLTSIAVFVPIVFIEGIAGQMFKDQALTVTFSLLASLVIAFTLIPMLASLGKGKSKSMSSKKVKTDSVRITELGLLDKISSWYEVKLKSVLNRKVTVLIGSFAVLLLSIQLLSHIPKALIPQMSEGEFYFEVTMPEGSSLPATDKVMSEMESIAMKQQGVERVYTSVGSRNVSGGLSLKTKDENLGQVNIVMSDPGDSDAEQQVIENLRLAYAGFPQTEIKFGRPSLFSLKTPLEVLLFGEDLSLLKEYTQQLMPKLQAIEGLVDLQISLETGNPELKIQFDRDKLTRLGLSVQNVSEILNRRINGEIVSKFNLPDRQIDIRLRNREIDRDSITDIENIVIGDSEGRPIILSAVATIFSSQGPAAIDRIQQSRVAVLAAQYKGKSLTDVSDEIERVIAENPPPVGVTFEFGGQKKEMEASFSSMNFAFLLAIFLVYLVMAATFEHLGHPFIILLTIPLAMVGVIFGLYITGYAISVIALIGVVFLIGVVVNNAIVLIDAINNLRRSGMSKQDAIIDAAISRLRPIMMTTLTTVLGLLPMAIGLGEGAELRAPLAIVVSFGLAFSTLLTLFVIPAAYSLMPSSVVSDAELADLDERIHRAELKEFHLDNFDNKANPEGQG
ncbi:MAG: efflux RND transporter permease subunit [Gammaproteobacteria bacterium]|nr:efflux RND transporter permease subunit [Gammaproteobacteria bacterium]MDH5629117.1 efflux RND transporter permease subunit [Gammaproteobacteria bacterium]